MDVIEVQIPTEEADEFEAAVNAAGIEHESALSRHMTGETALVSIVVPVTLTAVQVIAAYLIARRVPGKTAPSPELRIKIKGKFIREDDFSQSKVEATIEQRLK